MTWTSDTDHSVQAIARAVRDDMRIPLLSPALCPLARGHGRAEAARMRAASSPSDGAATPIGESPAIPPQRHYPEPMGSVAGLVGCMTGVGGSRPRRGAS